MPAPASVTEMLDLVRKSQIVPEDRLSAELEPLVQAGNLPNSTDKLAQLLIRQGLLTHFQARQLLAGRWRRFMIGGKYKLLELLGAGGMGAVYLCEHIFMQRLVAIKVLPVEKLSEPSMVERFYREARAAAALNHPNIVKAFDIDQFEKLHFLVMEYVDGASLQEIVGKHGPISVERAADYIAQTAAGLQHAHEAGMVHRDIKPGNLLVDRTGFIKILDMGLARFFGNKNDSVTEKYDERSVLGTADYLAPEQALNERLDIRADLYSLGATLHFCLTGQTLFPDGTIAQKLIWHQKKEPRPVRELRPDVPEALAAILKRMCAKKVAERYQQPYEVVEALAPWRTSPVGPPPDREMPKLAPAVLNAKAQMVAPPVPMEGMSGVVSKAALRSGSSPGTAPTVRAGPAGTESMPRAATPAAGVPASRLPTPAAGVPNLASAPLTGAGRRGPAPAPVALSEDEAEMAETLRQETNQAIEASMIMRMPQKKPLRLKTVLLAVGGGVLLLALVLAGVFFLALGDNPNAPGAKKAVAPADVPLPTVQITPPTPAPAAAEGTPVVVNGKKMTSEKLADRVGESVEVTFVVASTGGKTNLYLNAAADFKSPANFALKLTPAVQKQLEQRGVKDVPAYFTGKRVQTRGSVEKDDKGSVSITVDSADALKILPD